MTLPLALILEKNRLATPNPWILLLELTLPDTTVLRLAQNTENLTYGENVYTAFPFEVDPAKTGSQGEIPTTALRVSNVTRMLQAYLEEQNGCVGSQVKLLAVNAGNLAEDHADLELNYDVLATATDDQWVTFTLGTPYPQRKRFPLYRAIARHCNWVYTGGTVAGAALHPECGYVGPLTTCKRTLTDCQAHANSARFGGRPGMIGAFRVV